MHPKCRRATCVLPSSYAWPSGHLTSTFTRMHLKIAPHYRDYQLLVHCTALWGYLNKCAYASVTLDRLLVLLSLYDTKPSTVMKNNNILQSNTF